MPDIVPPTATNSSPSASKSREIVDLARKFKSLHDMRKKELIAKAFSKRLEHTNWEIRSLGMGELIKIVALNKNIVKMLINID